MAKFKVGQQVYVKGDDTPRTIEWYDPKKGYAISGEAIYYPEEDIVAANKKKAKNAKFKVGDIVIDKSFPHSGRFRIIRVDSDEQYSIQPLSGGAITGEWEENLVRVRANSVAANAKFKVGDKVYFYGRPATVKQVIREPDADYILDVQGDEFYAEDEEVTSRNSVACNSSNPVVQKALNACARNAIRGKGKIAFDDDVVEVFDPNGRSVYKGIWDDCPYNNDDMRYDASTMTYRIDGPNGDYRIVAKVSNAREKAANAKPAARNATEAEVAQYLSSTKTKIRDEVAFLKAVAAEMKAGTMTPAAEKAYGKVVKAMASLQKAFAELA